MLGAVTNVYSVSAYGHEANLDENHLMGFLLSGSLSVDTWLEITNSQDHIYDYDEYFLYFSMSPAGTPNVKEFEHYPYIGS